MSHNPSLVVTQTKCCMMDRFKIQTKIDPTVTIDESYAWGPMHVNVIQLCTMLSKSYVNNIWKKGPLPAQHGSSLSSGPGDVWVIQ